MTPLAFAIAQAVCAVGVIVLVRHGIAPYYRSVRDIERRALSPRRREHLLVLTDIWLPVAFAAPLLAGAVRVEHTVHGIGWLPIGAPISAALLIGGVALLTARGADRLDDHRPLPWALAAVLLLMLGAAHVLEMVVGQVFFAIGAVVLWMVTPPIVAHAPEPTPPLERRAGWATLGVLGLSVAHAILVPTVMHADAAWAPGYAMITAGLSVVGSGVIAAAAAGRARGLQLAGAIGMLGVFFGVGAIALARMVGLSFAMLADAPEVPGLSVAAGFERFTFESVALMALALAAVAARRLPGNLVRALGAVLLVGGVLLAVTN